jgi:hypothetical protein
MLAPFARSTAVVVTLALTAAPSVFAQPAADRATARQLGQDGQTALDAKDYTAAEDHFRRADALFHAPTLLLGYARAEAGLGKVVNASEAYNRIIREGVSPGAPDAFVKAVEAAKNESAAVEARLASVTVVVSGPDNPTVVLDDQPLPVAALGVKRPVDPGTHVVKATADGWEPAETTFDVVDAGSANATLAMKRSAVASVSPVASHPPALIGAVNVPAGAVPETDRVPATGGGGAQTTVGWVGIVVGGVGIATGAVAGVLAIGKHSTLASECPADCKQSDIDSYHAIGAISTVGFIAGGVLAGAGLVLILTAPPRTSSPAATTVTPYIGFGSFGAFGSF